MKRLKIALCPLVLLLTASCGGAGPDDIDISGTWNVSRSDSCGGSGNTTTVVIQNGADFSMTIPGIGPITGTIGGQNGTTASFTINFAAPCSGTATGTADFGVFPAVTGTFSGSAPGCCDPITGSFTMTRV